MIVAPVTGALAGIARPSSSDGGRATRRSSCSMKRKRNYFPAPVCLGDPTSAASENAWHRQHGSVGSHGSGCTASREGQRTGPRPSVVIRIPTRLEPFTTSTIATVPGDRAMSAPDETCTSTSSPSRRPFQSNLNMADGPRCDPRQNQAEECSRQRRPRSVSHPGRRSHPRGVGGRAWPLEHEDDASGGHDRYLPRGGVLRRHGSQPAKGRSPRRQCRATRGAPKHRSGHTRAQRPPCRVRSGPIKTAWQGGHSHQG